MIQGRSNFVYRVKDTNTFVSLGLKGQYETTPIHVDVNIVKNDVLTFAYRLNYEGTFGKSAPYYVLPYITVMGSNYDRDGMGGYRTVRV